VVRRFSDVVQVRVRSEQQSEQQSEPVRQQEGPVAGAARERPEAFIWKGRLYVVREVLAQWRERRAWWHDALDAEESQVRPGETLVAAASEQHVWRVEASPGWSFAPGVYDLAHDASPRGDHWSLVRVAD